MTVPGYAGWAQSDDDLLRSLSEQMRGVLRAAPVAVRRRYVLPLEGTSRSGAIAKLLYRQRRDRAAAFERDAALFSEPAWDLLLDLFIAREDGRRVPVSSACIGACAPASTVARCIRKLEARGLIHVMPHPEDRRVRLVDLTPSGVTAMEGYLTKFT